MRERGRDMRERERGEREREVKGIYKERVNRESKILVKSPKPRNKAQTKADHKKLLHIE